MAPGVIASEASTADSGACSLAGGGSTTWLFAQPCAYSVFISGKIRISRILQMSFCFTYRFSKIGQRVERRPVVGLAEHAELEAPRSRFHSAGLDGHGHVELHELVQLPVLQSGRSAALERAADALWTVVDADVAIESAPSAVNRSVTSSHIFRSM
jgi:hypothetical protein